MGESKKEQIRNVLLVVWIAITLLAWAYILLGDYLPPGVAELAAVSAGYGAIIWLLVAAGHLIAGVLRLLEVIRERT